MMRDVGREARERVVVAAQVTCRRGPDWGSRAGRTRKMLLIAVTLDVSKLSGWLNAVALCRFETRAYEAGRGAGREAGGRWVSCSASSVQARARV
eukprot:scaffold66509_cov49-Phaeocystis_antarctica.AAC.1